MPALFRGHCLGVRRHHVSSMEHVLTGRRESLTPFFHLNRHPTAVEPSCGASLTTQVGAYDMLILGLPSARCLGVAAGACLYLAQAVERSTDPAMLNAVCRMPWPLSRCGACMVLVADSVL